MTLPAKASALDLLQYRAHASPMDPVLRAPGCRRSYAELYREFLAVVEWLRGLSPTATGAPAACRLDSPEGHRHLLMSLALEALGTATTESDRAPVLRWPGDEILSMGIALPPGRLGPGASSPGVLRWIGGHGSPLAVTRDIELQRAFWLMADTLPTPASVLRVWNRPGASLAAWWRMAFLAGAEVLLVRDGEGRIDPALQRAAATHEIVSTDDEPGLDGWCSLASLAHMAAGTAGSCLLHCGSAAAAHAVLRELPLTLDARTRLMVGNDVTGIVVARCLQGGRGVLAPGVALHPGAEGADGGGKANFRVSGPFIAARADAEGLLRQEPCDSGLAGRLLAPRILELAPD